MREKGLEKLEGKLSNFLVPSELLIDSHRSHRASHFRAVLNILSISRLPIFKQKLNTYPEPRIHIFLSHEFL